MRTDQSTETRRPRLPASNSLPLVPLDPQPPNTRSLDKNNSSTTPKRPALAMHRTPNKTPTSNNVSTNANASSAPATPRLGYKASQATLSQGTPVAPRSPRPTVKREAGSTLGTESTVSGVASRRSSYVGPQVRPSSSMSTISNARTEIHSGSQSLRVTRPTNETSKQPSSPKLFLASDAKSAARRSLQPTIFGDVSQSQPPRLQSQASKFFYASEAINSSQTHLTPRLPTTPPIVSPQTPITSPQQLTSLNNTRNVKFVYANGTEEVLEPRRKNPSTSEGSSRPPSPNPYPLSPGPILSSKPTTSTASSVLSSPTQRVASSLERRASVESKGRHGRALSVGGNGVIQEIFLVPEALRSPVAPAKSVNGDEPDTTIKPIAMTMKMREELAANARRERKVMDLEISNASLLAINRTLERKMKKQTSELRRYRRLARSGALKLKETKKKRSRASLGSTEAAQGGETAEGGGNGNNEVELDNVEGVEEDEEEEEEEEDEEEDSSSADEGSALDGQPKSYNGKRAIVTTDSDKVSAELQKHQSLLDASAKTDALLVRCQFMIDEMMKDANKALNYRIAAADVKIGGRILGSDNEEDEDEKDEGGMGVGLNDIDGGEVTETDAEEGLTTEGETTDDGDYIDEEEEEGDVTETEDEDELEPGDQEDY